MRTAAFFLLVAAILSGLIAWREHAELDAQTFGLHRLALLEGENAALRESLADAERKSAALENTARRSQIEHDVSAIRELPFRSRVVYDVLSRAGIRQVIARKLSDQYTDQDLRDMSTGLAALGLLPPNFQLKQTYINLLGEQIAAFYDQHQHRLFMFEDASLENAQNRVILAHELTHALQDQNFGLLKLPLETRNEDDRAIAASALVEGDATLVMSQYMAHDLTWKSLTDTVGSTMTQSMDQIRKAPRYLREMLVFPYLKGQQFCAAVFARGGFTALSAVYAHPPDSTAQILHPEKYLSNPREEPLEVAIADPTLDGVKPLDENVLGEIGTRLLLEQAMDADAAAAIASGWRGDRYFVYEGGNALVWKTFWRSPAAAQDAANALETLARQRFKPTWAVKRGPANEVVFIRASTQKSADRLSEKFAGFSHG